MVIVHFLLQNGVGQNITAGAIGLVLGWLWARAKLRTLHGHLDALHASHAARHTAHSEHLERLGHSLIDLHAKLDRLEDTRFRGRANLGQLTADEPAAKPPRPRAPRTPKP